jgi:hypothetical protein
MMSNDDKKDQVEEDNKTGNDSDMNESDRGMDKDAGNMEFGTIGGKGLEIDKSTESTGPSEDIVKEDESKSSTGK